MAANIQWDCSRTRPPRTGRPPTWYACSTTRTRRPSSRPASPSAKGSYFYELDEPKRCPAHGCLPPPATGQAALARRSSPGRHATTLPTRLNEASAAASPTPASNRATPPPRSHRCRALGHRLDLVLTDHVRDSAVIPRSAATDAYVRFPSEGTELPRTSRSATVTPAPGSRPVRPATTSARRSRSCWPRRIGSGVAPSGRMEGREIGRIPTSNETDYKRHLRVIFCPGKPTLFSADVDNRTILDMETIGPPTGWACYQSRSDPRHDRARCRYPGPRRGHGMRAHQAGKQTIVSHLETARYLERARHGRRTRYQVTPGALFCHPAEGRLKVGALLNLLAHMGSGLHAHSRHLDSEETPTVGEGEHT